MFQDPQTTCWVVTDGKAGMENQCLGLAAALGLAPTVKRVKLRSPWHELSPFLRLGLTFAFSTSGDPIAPPFPDLLIATGRLSVPASLYVRRQSGLTSVRGRKRTFTVQLQNPVIDPSRFDLVVLPRHDGITGPNVMTTRGALHRIAPDLLKTEAKRLLSTVQHLPAPRIAVLMGGTSASYQLTPSVTAHIAQQLVDLLRHQGGSLMITPSRRTGSDNLNVLHSALKDHPAYIWTGEGHNPYYGMLGLADAILVTSDSVNMVSEACTTGKPVYVIDLPGGSEKFRRFHQSLRDDGMTRPFAGVVDTWNYQPLDDLQRVAERVTSMMAER